jgi:hypothetical protein
VLLEHIDPFASLEMRTGMTKTVRQILSVSSAMNIPAAGTIQRCDYVYKLLTWTHWIILLNSEAWPNVPVTKYVLRIALFATEQSSLRKKTDIIESQAFHLSATEETI